MVEHIGAGGGEGSRVKENKADEGGKFLGGARKAVGRVLKGIVNAPGKAVFAMVDMSNAQVRAEKHPIRTLLEGGVHLVVGGGMAALGVVVNAGSGVAGPALSPVITPIGGGAVTAVGLGVGTTIAGFGGEFSEEVLLSPERRYPQEAETKRWVLKKGKN